MVVCRNKDKKKFIGNEVTDVLDMLQTRRRDFKQTETLKPFYLKSINTLRRLLTEEIDLPHLYHKYINLYSEVQSPSPISPFNSPLQITFENTSKLLIRTSIYLEAREFIVAIFVD